MLEVEDDVKENIGCYACPLEKGCQNISRYNRKTGVMDCE
tara:strand:+ start:599 stop:718 length:120 start_codon:yes stop_codon:yes gene_type:complete